MPTPSSTAVTISPQGGYLARRCPEAVQLDVLRPREPLPTSQFMSMLGEAGKAFEGAVFDALRASFAGAADVDRRFPRGRREEITAAEMRDGATLVIGGRLPVDRTGLRVGEPDLLRRIGHGPKNNGLWAYVAVDVKHHIVRDGPEGTEEDAVSSLMIAPWVETGGGGTSERARCNYGDLSQLAHYQRLLEACGHQADEGRWGGIVGVGQRLAWYDLDLPRWEPSPYLGQGPAGSLSTMESYDAAFAHRISVIDAALRHDRDPTVPLLAEPVLIPRCPECGWRAWCYPRLEEVADLSLLPGLDLRRRRLHHEHAVTDLHSLARLDDRTARLLEAGVDLESLIGRAATMDPETPMARIIPRRRRQVADLAAEGLVVAADLRELEGGTLRYQDSGVGDLAGQIDRARARVGPHPAYRRRGVDRLDVPRGDIEIDVDMENSEQGTYLWGVLLTQRHLGGPPAVEYLPFVSWDPSASSGELDAFARFWDWLRHQRRAAGASGRTLRAYCYSKAAENGQMRRIADQLGLEDEVEAFITSDQWVDLYDVFRHQLITGTRMGLKMVAPLAGFHWRGEEPGGGQAMVRFAEAVVDSEDLTRAEARRWILEYNEDDVRATAALREWLDGDARLLPSATEIRP